MMHAQFMDRARNKTTTHFASKVYQVVLCIESEAEEESKKYDNIEFETPLEKIKLSTWEEYAYRMKCRSLRGSRMQALFHFLEIWYVSLR